jgi:hypothetical protein
LASILPGTASTVTVAVGATAAAGAQSITVTGSDATGTQSVTYALTVTQAPALTLTAASSSVAVVEGGSGTVSFTAATGGSFSGSISLSVSGLPAGVTAAWSANPVTPASGVSTNKAMLTLTASAGAKAGSANVVATAAGDGLTSSQSVVLQVQQPPGITLAALPAAVSLQLFSTATVTVTATPVGGATVQAGANGGSVSLYSENLTGIGGRSSALAVASAGGTSISVASGLPKGFTASWSTPGATYTGAVAWTLTLTGSPAAVAGSSTLSLSAKVAAKTGTVYGASLNVPMTVALTPPTLTVAAAASVSVAQGKTATEAVTLTGNGTYNGAVSLSVSGLPAGVTAQWSKNPVTLSGENGASTLTLTALGAATVGTAAITVTASGDGVTASRQIALQVQQAPRVQLTLGAGAR